MVNVIQNESKELNNKKVREMMSFFDDAEGKLGRAYIQRNIIIIASFIAFGIFLAVGVFYIRTFRLYFTSEPSILGIATYMVPFITAFLAVVLAYINLDALNNVELLNRYNDYDMLMYWILSDELPKEIRYKRLAKKLVVKWEDRKLEIATDGMNILGKGRLIKVVDFDNRTLTTN